MPLEGSADAVVTAGPNATGVTTTVTTSGGGHAAIFTSARYEATIADQNARYAVGVGRGSPSAGRARSSTRTPGRRHARYDEATYGGGQFSSDDEDADPEDPGDSDSPEDPEDPHVGGGGYGAGHDGDEFRPREGEKWFVKECYRYTGTEPFESYLLRFGHLADLCKIRPEIYKSTLYLKIGGPVGALVSDMLPSRRKYKGLSGGQYAEMVRSRLEPVTEKRLIYQQFLSRTQQTNESVDLYVLDKYNLFKRSTIAKSRNLDDFLDYSIRGLTNQYLKKKIREACVINVPKSFIKFRALLNKMLTLVQSRLQSGELDASEGAGCEVRLYSYSYMDRGEAGSASSRYSPSVPLVKEEKVHVLQEEDEDGVNWVGRKSFNQGGYPQKDGAFQRNTAFQGRNQGSGSAGGSGWVGRSPGATSRRLGNQDDGCFHCGQKGHWKNECPRKLHGFGKSVSAIDGEVNLDDGGEVDGDGVTVQDRIAVLTERLDKLCDFVTDSKGPRFPMKEDPQRSKGANGVYFLE